MPHIDRRLRCRNAELHPEPSQRQLLFYIYHFPRTDVISIYVDGKVCGITVWKGSQLPLFEMRCLDVIVTFNMFNFRVSFSSSGGEGKHTVCVAQIV